MRFRLFFSAVILFVSSGAVGQVRQDNPSTGSTTAEQSSSAEPGRVAERQTPAPRTPDQRESAPQLPPGSTPQIPPPSVDALHVIEAPGPAGISNGVFVPRATQPASPGGADAAMGNATGALRPCGPGEAGTAATSQTPPLTLPQGVGVSASQFRRAGVGADRFERPGVSAEQLATLLPGAKPAPCARPQDPALHAEPANQAPQRLDLPQDGEF